MHIHLFRWYLCFFSAFRTQSCLADLSWMRLAEERSKKEQGQGEDGRLQRAARDVENGNGDRPCTNRRTENNSPSKNCSFESQRWF